MGKGLSKETLQQAPALNTNNIETVAELLALKNAYSDKIAAVGYADGDWTLQFKTGEVFYWAGGKLLPKSQLAEKRLYRRYIGYGYSPQWPDPSKLSPQLVAALKRQGSNESQMAAPPYENSYFGALYGGISEEAVRARIVDTVFLNKGFKTHEMTAKALQAVEKRILALKKQKPVAAFLRNLGYTGSFYWRKIAGARSISYHSFGIAIDVLPKDFQKMKKAVYWNWVKVYDEDWPTLPLKERWMPPAEVVRAFEEEGFIWGGKWTMYDTMHFEYRPELKTIYDYRQELLGMYDKNLGLKYEDEEN